MKLIIKGVHIRVSPRLRAFVEAHLVEPIERFCDDSAASLEVHLVDTNGPKGGEDKECRVSVLLPGSRGLHLTETSESIYKSVALARDRLERMSKKEVEKKRLSSNRRPSRASARSFAQADLTAGMGGATSAIP